LIVPVERVKPIVERWLAEQDSAEVGYQMLATASGLTADAWRKRLSDNKDSGWWRLTGLDEADVDDLLSFMDWTHLWWTDFHDLMPAARGTRSDATRPGPPCRIPDDDLRTLHRLHIEHRLSAHELARQVYVRYGYRSAKSCHQAMRIGWKRLARNTRPQIEATQLATMTHGRLAGGKSEDVEERRRVRREYKRWHRHTFGRWTSDKGAGGKPKRCAAVRGNSPRKGEPCRAWAQVGKDFCPNHDPEKREAILATLAVARTKSTRHLKAAA
jgi:hypothetical protein